MPVIELTPAACSAVRSAATLSFRDTSVKLPNGNREVIVQQSTLDRLVEIQFPGETLSDTVQRLCATAGRPLQ